MSPSSERRFMADYCPTRSAETDQQTVRPDPVKNPRFRDDGERIFLYGASSGRAPACAMCHGSTSQAGMPMMGMMPMMANVPSLNGQHSAYIIDQL
jgi:cytochrome c553